MTDRTCETCRWWKGMDFLISKRAGGTWVLGYCEPERHVGGHHPLNVVTLHHCGLTAEDYSCGEHKERDND